MNITHEDLEQWAEDEKDPLVREGYILASEKIKTLSGFESKYKALKEAILDSNWTRTEAYDYKHHEYCNFCDVNLTRNKYHYDNCILDKLLKEK